MSSTTRSSATTGADLPTAAPGTSAFETDLAQIQAVMDKAVSDHLVPGMVVVVRREDRAVSLAAGAAQLQPAAPMTGKEKFRVGLVTKSFVAAIALDMVGQGRLALADPVEKWLPGLLPDGDRITVERLLTHSSGLFDFTDDPGIQAIVAKPVTPRQLVAVATSHALVFEPGHGVADSGTDDFVIGMLIEKVTGDPLENVLQRSITTPLGLDATALTPMPVTGPIAHGYQNGKDVTNTDLSWAWAIGGVVSSAPDLDRFLQALFTGKVVKPDLIAKLSTPHVTPAPGPNDPAYRLGLARSQWSCGAAWGQDSRPPGYVSAAWRAESGRQVVVLSNASDSDLGTTYRQIVEAGLCGS